MLITLLSVSMSRGELWSPLSKSFSFFPTSYYEPSDSRIQAVPVLPPEHMQRTAKIPGHCPRQSKRGLGRRGWALLGALLASLVGKMWEVLGLPRRGADGHLWDMSQGQAECVCALGCVARGQTWVSFLRIIYLFYFTGLKNIQ